MILLWQEKKRIGNTGMQLPVGSLSFTRLVAALRLGKKTCAVVEQCCGGLISASIMAQPGASQVYLGGSVVYNTRKSQALLLNDEALHQSLLASSKLQPAATATATATATDTTTTTTTSSREGNSNDGKQLGLSEEELYIQAKLDWTAKTSVAFCKELDTDYVIAEGTRTAYAPRVHF
jgi:nicotinamide mononucleotide (NMN) deamidase PncC